MQVIDLQRGVLPRVGAGWRCCHAYREGTSEQRDYRDSHCLPEIEVHGSCPSVSTLCGCCQTIWQEGPPTGNPDDDAVAGDPASQMVCQVLPLPFLSLSWFLPAGPSHTFAAKAEVHSVCFLLDKAHLLVRRVARGGLPRACAPRSSSSRSVRGRLSATTKVSYGEPSGTRRKSVDAGTLVTSWVMRRT